MMALLNTLDRIVDRSGRWVSWLNLAMVLVTFIVVIQRYLFNSGSIALQESVTYFHACVFLTGMAYTLQQDAHVRVDIFYGRFSARTRAWINLLGDVFFLLPFMAFIGWMSWPYILDSWAVLEGSREAGGLPGVFLLKSLIPVMTLLLGLQAVSQILRALRVVSGRAPTEDDG